MPSPSRSTTTPGPTSLSRGILPISCPLVIKCRGASRCVPTCSVDAICWPPTLSKATRLIHLIVGPSYVAKPCVCMSQFCERSITRILLRSIACIDVLSSLSAVSYRIKNDLINQLFDGRTVISKIDVACLLLADMSISNTGISDTFECWIGHSGSVGIKVAERCPCVGTNNQAILKALRVYDINIGKGRAHCLRQRY